MTFYADEFVVEHIIQDGGEMVLATTTTRSAVVIQLYVAGTLSAFRVPVNGRVEFRLARPRSDQQMLLLAVDDEDAESDFWDDAFGVAAANGNRIKVLFRVDIADGRGVNDVWRVYRGDAGDASATIIIHEAPIFPSGINSMGWGISWGNGGWGYGGADAPGWGNTWGYSWGFGTTFLSFISEPLIRGVYPVKIEVEDDHGNVSSATETSITLDTFARPADDLAVSSYTLATDTLVLTMTPSPDLV